MFRLSYLRRINSCCRRVNPLGTLQCRKLGSGSDISKCWKCEGERSLNQVICTHCGIIQKPDANADYFTVLGVEPKFDFNRHDLNKRLRNLQWNLHPDRFSRSSKEEQEISSEYSSLVNHAYKILNNPYKRGMYLLELQGKGLQEAEIQVESDFLMDIMELNEELGNNKTPMDRIKEIATSNETSIALLVKETSAAFKKGDLDECKLLLNRMKYLKNIRNKVKEYELKYNVVLIDDS